MFEDTKQAFGESFKEERKRRSDALREKVYDNTGFLGTVLRRIEDDKKRAEQDQQAASKIEQSTQVIVARNASLTSMQVTFTQISKNLQNIAKLWDAETVLLEETLQSRSQPPGGLPVGAPPVAATKKAPEGPVKVGEEPMSDGSPMLTGLTALSGVLSLLKGRMLKMAKKKLLKMAAQMAAKKAAKAAARAAVKAAAEKAAKAAAKKAAKDAAMKAAKEAAKKAAADKAAKDAAKTTAKGAAKTTTKAAGKKITVDVIKRAASKGVAKAIGKMTLKSVPIIGAGIGLLFAAGRLMEGDFAGAGVEAAGGLAGPITAIPATIVLIAHDTYKAVYGVAYFDDDPGLRESRFEQIKNVVKAMMSELMANKLDDKKKQQIKETEEAAAATNEFGDDYNAAPSSEPTPAPAPAPKPEPPAKPPSLESKPPPSSFNEGTGLKPGGGLGLKPPSGSMDMGMKMTMQHEGVRYKPYKDTLGLWTIGVGHLIGDGKTLPDEWNRTLTHDEVMALYEKDYEHHKEYAEKIPSFNKMNDGGKSALIDLTFNMGPSWYKKWPTLMKQLNAESYDEAADNLLGSKWAGQVKSRANTVTELIRNAGKESVPGEDIASASTDVAMAKRAKKTGGVVNNVVIATNTVVTKKAASPQPQTENTRRVA